MCVYYTVSSSDALRTLGARNEHGVLTYIGDKVASFDDINCTICHVDCTLLLDNSTLCCSHCKLYQRNTLNRLLYRFNNESKSKSNKENTSSHINYRFMDSDSKDLRMKKLQLEVQNKNKKLKRLESVLQQCIREESIPVDDTLHSDLLTIMNQHVPSPGNDQTKDFKEIFWKQQLQAFAKKNPKSIRWHPLVVKWCLYLHHKSSGAYETLRNSGVVCLPSGRTLRDYRHFAPVTAGLSSATDKQLRDLAQKTSPLAKHVVVLIDEMYVRGGLVFNKSTGAIIGFVDLGDLNNHFVDLENLLSKGASKRPLRPLAKTLLVFMIRGVVTNLIFPYALYPATSLRGCDIFPLLWDVIERLTRNHFRVLAVTCDGATCNRSMFRLHSTAGGVVYKTRNVYSAENEYIYFISDPPHLIKTIRNCFANSKRALWVSK
ncbi:hypothetical protein SPONL_1742 [uncultured Candidatus Thioglobus sp.]|nr:hypothetical protein SPONL_1742 [uncultured Candidatus Thioglobus sp.]